MSDPEFEALLDKIAEEMEGQEEDDDPIPLERHRWGNMQVTTFSNDVSRYECQKCGAKMLVSPNQSVAEAMLEQGVLANCVENAVREVEDF